MIWATRSGSHSASTGSRRRSQLEVRLVRARAPGVNSAATLRASSPTSVGSGAQLERPGLEPGEVEQVGGQLAAGASTCSRIWREELAPRLLVEVLVLEQLEEAAEREDRRAQLVRGGGDEALARVSSSRELALHLVERRGELAELVVGVDAGIGREKSPAATRRGGPLEPLDAPRERAGDE